MFSKRAMAALAVPLMALTLAGCGSGAGNDAAANGTAAERPSDRTLADQLGSADGLDTVNDLARNAGLEDVLGGIGPYTIFAPTDAAFKAMGDDRISELKSDAMKAQDASLMTAHIVPGFLTTQDIENAIAANNGAVEMTTMADGKLTFSKEGGALVVTADNGAKATLTGSQTLASNGAIHPVSALLLPTEVAQAKTEQ
ncbi:fasciclin domain-containing protein [Stakelama marina]|uniref:Fasciclin domain-containing protein n=1 Tax=Stakelama marina TaxID=2826939 RepID=A0A8T4IBJ4_9SPHN|nr:fasciclin domain-containing protein [Stakelama marina]MBR0551803.1 fasciclin domain-containing protein [Stakelama marina]